MAAQHVQGGGILSHGPDDVVRRHRLPRGIERPRRRDRGRRHVLRVGHGARPRRVRGASAPSQVVSVSGPLYGAHGAALPGALLGETPGQAVRDETASGGAQAVLQQAAPPLREHVVHGRPVSHV